MTNSSEAAPRCATVSLPGGEVRSFGGLAPPRGGFKRLLPGTAVLDAAIAKVFHATALAGQICLIGVGAAGAVLDIALARGEGGETGDHNGGDSENDQGLAHCLTPLRPSSGFPTASEGEDS